MLKLKNYISCLILVTLTINGGNTQSPDGSMSIFVRDEVTGYGTKAVNSGINIEQNTQNTAQNQSEINLRFLDEATGYMVIPEYVEIKHRESEQLSHYISKKQIAHNGTFTIKVANGVYDITVNAQGYAPMTTFFELNNQTLKVNFNLVPITPRKELSSEYIQALHRSDAIVIVGFIVDDATGKPLDKVVVYSADEIIKAFSKENGFFQIIVPLAENENIAEDRGTLFFEKDNYTTEVRQNFDMWPNGDAIFQVRMKKGVGLHKVNIIHRREANIVILR